MITKTKEELIKAVAQEAEITKAAAEVAVNAVIRNMTDTLKGLGRFQLPGIGVFSMVKRAPREGRNPQNGQPIRIPGKWAVRFKEGAELKRVVNA
jgi:DNA-binding protein HU-beta